MDDAAVMDSVQEAHIKAYMHLHKYLGQSSFFPVWPVLLAMSH